MPGQLRALHREEFNCPPSPQGASSSVGFQQNKDWKCPREIVYLSPLREAKWGGGGGFFHFWHLFQMLLQCGGRRRQGFCLSVYPSVHASNSDNSSCVDWVTFVVLSFCQFDSASSYSLHERMHFNESHVGFVRLLLSLVHTSWAAVRCTRTTYTQCLVSDQKSEKWMNPSGSTFSSDDSNWVSSGSRVTNISFCFQGKFIAQNLAVWKEGVLKHRESGKMVDVI